MEKSVWAGEKGEKRKTTAAWKEIQHCQMKATVTGRIYFLAEGFPMSSVTEGRRKNPLFRKISSMKIRIQGGAFPSDAAARRLPPTFLLLPHSPREDEFSPAKTAPDKILFPAYLAGRCVSATANTSKPPSPTAGQASAPGTRMCPPEI